jgi:hypothetical protein
VEQLKEELANCGGTRSRTFEKLAQNGRPRRSSAAEFLAQWRRGNAPLRSPGTAQNGAPRADSILRFSTSDGGAGNAPLALSRNRAKRWLPRRPSVRGCDRQMAARNGAPLCAWRLRANTGERGRRAEDYPRSNCGMRWKWRSLVMSKRLCWIASAAIHRSLSGMGVAARFSCTKMRA